MFHPQSPETNALWRILLGVSLAGALAVWAGFTKDPWLVFMAAATFGILSRIARGNRVTTLLVILVVAAVFANLVVAGLLVLTTVDGAGGQ